MSRRDGPQPQQTAKGPEQKGDERPRLLPRAQTPRKTTQGHSSTSHRRVRRRQPHPAGWRQFSVRVVTGPDNEAVHALHSFLREAARRYGLTIVRIDKIGDDDKSE